MADPLITLPDPLVIPAREEAAYPHGYLIDLSIQLEDRTTGQLSCRAAVWPYDAQTHTLSPEGPPRVLRIPDVYAEAGRSTLFAQAVGLIITVVNLGLQERSLLEQLAAIAADDPARAALEQSLTEVRQGLGVVT